MGVILKHSYADRGNDAYKTPPEAIQALLKYETLPPSIWDPCCGTGSIAQILKDSGHSVFATDIENYGYPLSMEFDFLSNPIDRPAFPKCIVTNPPFRYAEKFVEKALTHCTKVIMLQRLAFLESEKRSNILDNGELARVLVFKSRLPMMHRHGWDGPKASSTMAFAWFIWQKGWPVDTTIRRITWK